MRLALGILCLAGAAYVLRRHLQAKPPPSPQRLEPVRLFAAQLVRTNELRLRRD